jgi:acetyl-CoA carboxylase biotin carboxyl carrier protein
VTEAGARPPVQASGDAAIGLDVLAEEVLPALIARLRASRLGELEVRSGDWRVRLRRDVRVTRRSARPSGGSSEAASSAGIDEEAVGVARSPAVGYFSPAPLLAVGRSVAAGDALGSIDVLGISQEVTAPSGGVVSAVLAEAGQAVEYGQALAEIDPLEDPLGPSDDDGDDAEAAGLVPLAISTEPVAPVAGP